MSAIPQHMQALGHANNVRLGRAKLKGEVRELASHDGIAMLAGLILEPPTEMESAAIFDVLQWPARMGRSRAMRVMHGIGHIGERRHVGTLTARERRKVADVLVDLAERS